jgi:hypothetical protein
VIELNAAHADRRLIFLVCRSGPSLRHICQIVQTADPDTHLPAAALRKGGDRICFIGMLIHSGAQIVNVRRLPQSLSLCYSDLRVQEMAFICDHFGSVALMFKLPTQEHFHFLRFECRSCGPTPA